MADGNRTELYRQQVSLATELLGHWYLFHDAAPWLPAPLEWFPTPQLQAIAKAINEGCAPNRLELVLMKNGGRKLWQSATEISELLISEPSRHPASELRERLEQTHRKRELKRATEDLVGKIEGKTLEETRDALNNLLEQHADRAAFIHYSADDIFADLGPIPWICEGLRLTAGAPTLIAGPGYAGKTMLAQELAVAIATGDQALGCYNVNRGKVLHLDKEQGRRRTFSRYKRIAAAHQYGREALKDLSVVDVGAFTLEEPRAESTLARLVEGVTLCILDSLRTFAPTTDENSAFIRNPLDLLFRVSERTGCAFIMIHHLGKQAPLAKRERVDMIRGSSSIFDACQTVYVLDRKKKDSPAVCWLEKDRVTGKELDPFELNVFEDEYGGLGVTATAVEAEEVKDSHRREQHRNKLRTQIEELLKAAPDGVPASVLRDEIGGRPALIITEIDRLEMAGKVSSSKVGRRIVYKWTGT